MKKLFLAVCMLLLLSSAANATLLTNGSFETGDITGWTASPAWGSWGGPSVSTLDNGLSPADGSYLLRLQMDEAYIKQSGASILTAGDLFTLSYYATTDGYDAAYASLAFLDINGDTIDQVTSAAVATNHSWALYTLTLNVPTGATQWVVTLSADKDPNVGYYTDVYFDGVSLASSSAVPLPASVILFGFGLMGLVPMRKKLL